MNKCSVDGCLFKLHQGNYCKRHWNRMEQYGNLLVIGKPSNKNAILQKCDNSQCENLIWYKGYCKKCKRRIQYRGDCNIVNPPHKKYTLDENSFDIINNDIAWVLGWIATDGYVSEKKGARSIRISIIDKEPLEKIAKITKTNVPIKVKIFTKKDAKNGISTNRKPLYQLALSSKKLVDRCVELGIKQNKSLTIEMPQIPDEYFYSFLRGVVEGDGSVVFSKGKLYIFINSASKKFIDQLKAKIPFNSCIVIPNKKKKNIVYRLCLTGKYACALCQKMYENCGDNYLFKKYQKYADYCKFKNLNTV